MGNDDMRVFISYSWDSKQHKTRVADLVKDLRGNGIGAEFDGDIILGERIPHYMETRVAGSDYVLFVCTPKYKEKADNRAGGVGYESNIITGELYSSQNEKKFIPLLFSGTWETSLPAWAAGKNGLDFTTEEKSQTALGRLLDHLGASPTSDKTEVAPSPAYIKKLFQPKKSKAAYVKKTYTLPSEDEPIRVLRVITEEVSFPKNDGTHGSALYSVPFELSRYPSASWRQLFVQSWNSPPRWTTLHRPGIASVSGRKIILNGTTIDEVERTHKETLLLAVGEANKKEQEYQRRVAMEEKRKTAEKKQHLQNVEDTAKRITFDD
jgi:hypothetical protein